MAAKITKVKFQGWYFQCVTLYSWVIRLCLQKNRTGKAPIQLWNRYLPDYFGEVLLALFDN